jgi:hypothetical protein
MRICSHEGCDTKARSRGMCSKHYEKWRKANPNALVKYDDMRDSVLQALPATRMQVQANIGCARSTAQDWLKQLRDEGVIHIGKWLRPEVTGKFVAVYVAGPGKDAVCKLKPKCSADYAGRYREQSRERERIRYRLKRASSRQNTWLGALGVA